MKIWMSWQTWRVRGSRKYEKPNEVVNDSDSDSGQVIK